MTDRERRTTEPNLWRIYVRKKKPPGVSLSDGSPYRQVTVERLGQIKLVTYTHVGYVPSLIEAISHYCSKLNAPILEARKKRAAEPEVKS